MSHVHSTRPVAGEAARPSGAPPRASARARRSRPAAGGPRRHRRHAFTLVEMLVSLAVVAVALSVVGVVFAITTRTVSQAAAVSEVHALLRQFMTQLEEDLRFVEPTQSVLIIHGRMQRAALTRDDLDARLNYRVLVGNPNDPALQNYDPKRDGNLDANRQYSNPRADILGFFTTRQVASQAPPLVWNGDRNNPYVLGARFSPVHVVYGHAALAEPLNAGGNWTFGPVTHITPAGDKRQNLSEIPCSQWHLARRALIIEDTPGDLRARSFRRYHGGADFEWLRRCFPKNSSEGGDIARINFRVHLGAYPLAPGFSTPAFVGNRPYDFDQSQRDALDLANEMLYGASSGADLENRHVATVIPEPPAELRSNLGVHLLPGCAWFQVEFLMPEDPRNSRDYYDPLPLSDPNRNRRDDMPQWVRVPQGQTFIFVPDTPENRAIVAKPRAQGGRLEDFASIDRNPANIAAKRIRTWPYAIRVTVKVFDTRGRLSDPIERTLVHRFD